MGTTLALAMFACSIVATNTVPSDWDPNDELECTSSWAYAATDATAGVLSGILGVNLLSAAGNRDQDQAGLRTAGYATLGVGVLFLASSAYGLYQRHRCAEAEQRAELDLPRADPVIDRPRAGSLGGACHDDRGCDDDLICDAPMGTCIPATPTDQDM